jgi:hypothetical protein bacD2_15570
MDGDLKYTLQGTARGTVFEGERWIDELLSDLTEENARHQIAQRFEGRFSYGWLGMVYQTGRASWDEKYGLLSLFNKGCHYMYMSIHGKQFRDPTWDNYPRERLNILKKGYILAELSWIAEDSIGLQKCIRQYTGCDHDEPEIRMKGIYDSRGHLKAPFSIEEIEIY